MKTKLLALIIFSFVLFSCQPPPTQPSSIPESGRLEPTPTRDPATQPCPPDQLDSYLSNYEQIMNDFLETSKIATFIAEKRLESTIVMLSYISDLGIVSAPECAHAHKESAIAAMHQLVEATLKLETKSELTESDVAILEPALREIGRVNDEAAQLDALLK